MLIHQRKIKTPAQKHRRKFLMNTMEDHDTDAAKIARSLGIDRSAVTHFINKDINSPRIAAVFARLSGKTIKEILAL
jgi:predicted XRE-type DNA-binding protein